MHVLEFGDELDAHPLPPERSPCGGTDALAPHDGLPRGVAPADNELGWRSSLAKLAALVEAGESAEPAS